MHPDDRWLNGKCLATYRPVPGRDWFLYCSLPLDHPPSRHQANDAGGSYLMAWGDESAAEAERRHQEHIKPARRRVRRV